ncbi:hypothetical protein SDC9_129887 [bioreactor metagenome]|uniref:Uncharacterized protein n=1 Tax=bioreactor metagenome TaxID=1076179 RepID=A0A645D129_9ZZZZ
MGCPQVVFTSLPGSATEQELAKFKTVTADPPKNVSQPEPVLLAENTQVFVPKGIASVVLKDGRQYSAIANTLLFVSWFEGHIGSMLYQGLDEKHEDRNYKHEDLIYFEDMQEFTVKLTDDDKTGYFQITDYDNQQQTKKINNPTEEIWFIDADQPSELRKVNFQALNTVKFNHGMKPDKPILMTLIQRKDQPDLAVPQAFIQFGLRDSTNVVPRGYWSTDLPLETNGKIALKRLKSITIDQVIRTPAMYQMYTEAELTIEKKNGEIIKDRLNENITMHVLTKSGLSEPLIAKMTKIIFNALDI